MLRMILIDPREADFERRGFRCGEPGAQAQLTRIGRTFVDGYNAAWTVPHAELAERLAEVDPGVRGFAAEGAAMALMLGDTLLPWRRARWSPFAAGPAEPYVYLAIVGAGWAFARTGRLRPRFALFDPLLRWLVFDGRGFHDAYFRPHRTVALQRRARGLTAAAAAVYDQGVGRALWFVACADPGAIADTIAGFAAERRADLWAGAGLAAAYAGGAGADALQALRGHAAGFEAHVAQGAAFAAKAHQRAGMVGPACELAARILCGCGADDAAFATDLALRDVPDRAAADAYERWRAATRRRLRTRREAA